MWLQELCRRPERLMVHAQTRANTGTAKKPEKWLNRHALYVKLQSATKNVFIVVMNSFFTQFAWKAQSKMNKKRNQKSESKNEKGGFNMFGALNGTDYIAVRLAYSLKETSIRHSELKSFLQSEGLDAFIPREPNPANVFRRVTGALAGTRKIGGLRYKVDVIRVNEIENLMERILMVVEVDEKGREVTDGRKVCRLFFNKDLQRLNFLTKAYCPALFSSYLTNDLIDIPEFLQDELDALHARFDEQTEYLSPDQLRDVLYGIVKSVGIPVHDIQSLWTVPKHLEETVKAFTRLADKINALGFRAISYDVLPVMDGEELKEKISADAVIYAAQRFEKMLCEEQERIEAADNPDKALEKARIRFNKEADEVMSLISEYESIIGPAMDKIKTARRRTEENLITFEIRPDLAMVS